MRQTEAAPAQGASLPLVRRTGGREMSFRDVAKCRVTRGAMKGTYRLPRHPRHSEFRDSSLGNAPVGSVGKALRDLPGAAKGAYFAALDSRFYSAGESGDWECVWLR